MVLLPLVSLLQLHNSLTHSRTHSIIGDVNVIYDNPLPFYRVLISRGDDGTDGANMNDEASMFSDKTRDALHKKQLNLDHFQKLTRERAR